MRNIAPSVRAVRLSVLSGVAVLATAAVVLSGCEVTEAGDSYHSGLVCPAIYKPVCAERRGQERTFPNACEAQARNWRILGYGQCRAGDYDDYRRDRDDWDRDYRRDKDRDRDRSRPIKPPPPPIPLPPLEQRAVPGSACPQVFEQVCGQLGDKTQQFMNRCELLRAGATEVAAGQCLHGDR